MLKCEKKIGRRNSRTSLRPNFFLACFLAKKFFGETGAKILRIVSLLKILSWKPSFSKKSGRLTRVFTLLMSHNNSHASSNFFSHWRCLLYFICLEIPQNFARNKKNSFFDKDLVLYWKAGEAWRARVWDSAGQHTSFFYFLFSLQCVFSFFSLKKLISASYL